MGTITLTRFDIPASSLATGQYLYTIGGGSIINGAEPDGIAAALPRCNRGLPMSKASDLAYARIRAGITGGEWAPGAPLREEDLATLCGVSRTPVREALRRLEAEYLVRRSGGARSFVADWSADDIAEMFALRAILEGHAAARAATRIGAEALAALAALNAEIEAAIPPGDTDRFLAANRAFHAIVLDAAQSPRLAAMLTALVEQPVVRRTARHYGSAEFRRSHAEHAALIEALRAGDAQWAESTMTGHIRRAFHVFAAVSGGERTSGGKGSALDPAGD
jgi:DNA-binding GntR family transcriptional regulator